jgi:cation:H+ antiporter
VNFAEWSVGLLMVVFAAAAVVVWMAGSRLARYANAISEHTGIGRAFIGMILLGGITSLPELAVAVTATLEGNPMLSVNDVLGSAAINIVLLALADAFIGRKALTSTLPSSAVMLQGALSIALLAMVAGAVITGDRVFLGIGVWSWLMLLVYAAGVALLANARASSQWKPAGFRAEKASKARSREDDMPLGRLVALTCVAAACIVIAGFLLAQTGAALAEQTGLGTSFFGAVVLAASTSLPELSTILSAVRLRQYEMAISDAIGTNLFNVTILVLVDAIHPGKPVLPEAGRFAAFGALLALMLTATFLVGMLERRDRTVLRMGIDSAVVLLAYFAGVVVLYGLR